MKKCAIAIGVNKTGRLPTLFAAVDGALKFSDWATSQGFDVSLHVDDGEKKVKVGDIFDSIESFVLSKSYSQMIVYFSGHGILKAPSTEVWLLSQAERNSSEAINVTQSIALARECGIGHIVFISDACRSLTEDFNLGAVNGSSIFPTLANGKPRPKVDQFYATVPGNPSIEAKFDVSTGNFKGIFTECLLEGLNGSISNVLVPTKINGELCSVVPSYELSDYLVEAVPIKAQKVNIMLTQNPEGMIQSRFPMHLSKFPDASVSKGPRLPAREFVDSEVGNRTERLETTLRRKLSSLSQDMVDRSMAKLLKRERSTSVFGDRGTGFVIEGDVKCEFIFRGTLDHVSFGESSGVRISEANSAHVPSLLVKTERGITPVAVLPEFIGKIIIEDGQVVNVNYSPSRQNSRYQESKIKSAAILERRALIALAARYGIFQLEGDNSVIRDHAGYLRRLKGFDPTLGLYASYAYAQSGENLEIADIYGFMVNEPEPVLFDVALLARVLNPGGVFDIKETSPFCPLLTQGWSYLSLEVGDDSRSKLLQQASRYLVPGLWTTFSGRGQELIEDAYLKGIIL